MYQKILVPLDGSELSECALGHVMAIAKGCQVPEVVLLMAVEPRPEAPEGAVELRQQGEKRAEAYANEYIAKVADELKKEGIRSVQATAIKGRPDELILDYAKINDVDLIIMSTHGRSGVSRWAMGSVTDRVLRHSLAAVLVAAPEGCRVSR